jgi:type III restriction enzyme
MKIKFKSQDYQTSAVNSVVDCFKGQSKTSGVSYRIDPGKKDKAKNWYLVENSNKQVNSDDNIQVPDGIKNSEIEITPEQLLTNIQEIQQKQDLPVSEKLVSTSVSPINLAQTLDISTDKVVVYAKLPKSFSIPTPLKENYTPDWAIAFKKGSVKHIYFIAETKGSMSSMQLKEVERIKIECAKKYFKEISNENVVYDKIDSYEELIKLVS